MTMGNKQLKVGVYMPNYIPPSFRVYTQNVIKYFPDFEIDPIIFTGKHDIPKDVDVLWDVRSGGGVPPLEFMFRKVPVVVTVHGFAPISLSGWEYFTNFKEVFLSKKYANEKIADWRKFKDKVAALIAVSNFSKLEATQITGVSPDKIFVCCHGVDWNRFKPHIQKSNAEPYLLHISNNEPRKNIARILKAYKALRKTHDIGLTLKLSPEQTKHYYGIPGVTIIDKMLSEEDLASLYRNALAFVFPSLYEGFGLPIFEAMASGCPVITSNVSACPEVAADAALIIDPRNTGELHRAMKLLCDNEETRKELIQRGYQRVTGFSWEKSAQCHAKVFHSLARPGVWNAAT